MKKAVESLEIAGQRDAFLETVVGLDQVVVGADFPGVAEVAAEFGFPVGRDPSPLEVPLSGLVTLDVCGRQPSKRLVPGEPSSQLL